MTIGKRLQWMDGVAALAPRVAALAPRVAALAPCFAALAPWMLAGALTGALGGVMGVAHAQGGAAVGSAAEKAQLHEAVVAAAHGDMAGALAIAQTLSAQHPGFAPGWKFKGALLEQTGQAAEAEECYEHALRLAPKDGEVLFKVGLFQLVAGQDEKAIDLLARSSKLDPKDAETLFYLAQAYHLHGDNDLALKTAAKSLQLDPSDPPVLQKYGELLCSSGDNAGALQWLVKAQQADPKLDRIDFDLAVASYANQDLDNAVMYGMQAVARRPDDLQGLALLAGAEVKLARWQDAKAVFEHILSLKSGDPASLLGLGHCELALKEYQPAVDHLQLLLRQDSTTILAHFYLARAYAGLGDKADAEHEAELHSRLVEQAASVVPRDEREIERTTLVQARQMLAEGKEVAALQLFRERAKGPTATVGEPYLLVSVVYLYMGRSDDAERLLLQALATEPGVRQAHTYLGLLALQQRDLVKAETEFRTELAADPNSQLAVAEMGEVRYRQQRWNEAAEQFARSKTVNPALLYMLSDSYFHLGKVKDADLTAELAVDYAKGDRETLQRVVDLLNQNRQTDEAKRLGSR